MFVTQDSVHPLSRRVASIVVKYYNLCVHHVVWLYKFRVCRVSVACLLVCPSISFSVVVFFFKAHLLPMSMCFFPFLLSLSRLMGWLIYQLSLQITQILSADNQALVAKRCQDMPADQFCTSIFSPPALFLSHSTLITPSVSHLPCSGSENKEIHRSHGHPQWKRRLQLPDTRSWEAGKWSLGGAAGPPREAGGRGARPCGRECHVEESTGVLPDL